MRIKKSEAYEFVGFAQPAEGDDVFEAASDGGEMAGLAGMLAKEKGKPQDTTDPDNDPPKPKKKVKPSTADDAEPVSAAKSTPTDPAQEWLAPIKQKFLEARKAGASMAELKQMLLSMHPNTKALAKAFANNILAGFAGESEEVDAANPWGCNQYGHRKGHKGGESKKKESDDVYDFDNMEPDERLQQAIDDLGEVEEEDINWADYDKAQEVKKIFHPDNHKVAQWRKERMINEVGNRVTDALRHLANVNKASRDFRNPNRPTEDDVTRAEEAFGKAVHEWRRFHRARLEAQGWDKKAIDGYLSRWPEYLETANADEVDAANPYGCNQYGEGWKAPHNGRASKVGAPVKKTDPSEEERKQNEEQERQRQEEQQRKEEEERKARVEKEKKAKVKHLIGQATTREEAIEHTRSLLSPEFRETGEVEFDDSVTLEQINEINATLKELTDKYPVKTLRRIGTYVDESDTVGAQATSTKIEFNIDHENGGIKGLHNWRPYGYDKVQETGYTRHNVGATNNGISLRDLTTHEYGHVIQAKISHEYEWLQNKKAQGYDISKFDAQYEAMKKWRRVYGRAKTEKGYPPRSDIQRNLSKYAMKNDREFFSECFVARERGEKLPAYIEKGLDDMISFVNMNS